MGKGLGTEPGGSPGFTDHQLSSRFSKRLCQGNKAENDRGHTAFSPASEHAQVFVPVHTHEHVSYSCKHTYSLTSQRGWEIQDQATERFSCLKMAAPCFKIVPRDCHPLEKRYACHHMVKVGGADSQTP